jgi:hypothetical protein
MISRNVVRAKFHEAFESFHHWLVTGDCVPKGQPRIARSFNCGFYVPKKITSPGGAAESPAAILSVAPPGLDWFWACFPPLKRRAIIGRRSATLISPRRQPDDFTQGGARTKFHEAFELFHHRLAPTHVVKFRRTRDAGTFGHRSIRFGIRHELNL